MNYLLSLIKIYKRCVKTPEFTVKVLDISSHTRGVILNYKDAKSMGVRTHDRVKVTYKESTLVCWVDTTNTFISPGNIGVFRNVADELGLETGVTVNVDISPPPISSDYVKKKMDGKALTKEEIYAIVNDIVNGNLTQLEIAAFAIAEKYLGMTLEETEYLTRAIADTGEKITFDEPVFDKHSIGGVPGNKVTLLIVPIIAAAGLLIPKTSSRAITSPSGTADTMEVLAPVEIEASELKRIATKTRGAIVWGGALNIAPADDLIIQVEYPLSLDPHSQIMASIYAKKLAVGANFLVLDIPVGPGTKMPTMEAGRKFAREFVALGERLGIEVECGITYGGQPVGHAIGPALEAKEALMALMGKGPNSLIEKSTALAGILLEMGGVAQRGLGKDMAKEILFSGKALKKMREIIAEQGGDPNIKPDDLPIGDKSVTIPAPADGYIASVNNTIIKKIARIAGAPVDKGAGVLLYGKVGYKVKRGDPLFTIYAEKEAKLNAAHTLAITKPPITVEGMLLQRISSIS